MNPTQLKLLIILSIFGSFWNHGKHYAETYIVDCLWPITQALHNCHVGRLIDTRPRNSGLTMIFIQEKIRTISRQLLSKILRTYSARQNRAIKGIEILAVTSYDAALQGLLVQANTSSRQQTRAIPINFPLETMIVLWEKSPLSLKYKMNTVRSDRYYDVPCLWNAIEPLLRNRNNSKITSHLLSDLLPLMAFWDPESFVPYLDSTLRFLTDSEPSALGKCLLQRSVQTGLDYKPFI